jgi:2-keto-4-pentenoate hydratase/2-oxohepta-3-ene-1,7-dioic acid hydratase in catechol pathway
MTRLHRLILFFLVFLHVSNLNAQEEKQDSVGTEVKRVMTRVTDGLVTGVRYTEDKLKEVGLQLPFTYKVQHELQKEGYSLELVMSTKEMVKEICQLNSKK